jgi:DNA-binding LacI/PurR family transcriptional regulator
MLLMLHGAESEARAREYNIILSHVESQQEEIDTLRRLHQENIAGVLIWPDAHASKPDPINQQIYQEITLPMVVMDRMIYGVDCDCVTSDHYAGARELMQYLVELGHKHIAFVTHQQQDLLAVKERYSAYATVLRENGLSSVDPWTIGQPGVEIRANYALRSSIGFTSPELQQLKDYMLAADPRPTAIFALNDYMALMTIQAMKLLNLSIPDTISIAGFDDIDLAAHLEVPLTTVAQDPFMIGKRAARQLFDRLEGYSGPSIRENIPVQLRIRHSTAVPSKEVRTIE